ncbi:hypothetical protein, partial [Campylobacter concisus]|uniref:hypothetical protein n=1 Tax=Campylobacter concisus TaxID=199 RepID=UPI00112F7E3D
MITQVCFVLQNAIVWQKQNYHLAGGLWLDNQRLSGSLMPMRGLSCRFRYTISQRNLGKQMGNFFHTMRQIQRDKEQLDRNVIQALFSLPVFWLFSMLLAAGLGMG